MKPLLRVYLSAIIFLTGCTTTRYISLTTQFEEPSITLKNGVNLSADYAKGGLDSLACIKLKSANRLFIPEIEVEKVSTGGKYKYIPNNYSEKYLMIEVSSEQLPSVKQLIEKPLLKNESPLIKVEVTSIINETSKYLSVLWENKKITLPKSYIKEIIRSNERIILVIHLNVYVKQFKSY